jgi:hypothetical protein
MRRRGIGGSDNESSQGAPCSERGTIHNEGEKNHEQPTEENPAGCRIRRGGNDNSRRAFLRPGRGGWQVAEIFRVGYLPNNRFIGIFVDDYCRAASLKDLESDRWHDVVFRVKNGIGEMFVNGAIPSFAPQLYRLSVACGS